MREQKEAEVPLTTGTVVRWTGIIVALISALVSTVWFVSSLKADITTIHVQLDVYQREYNDRKSDVDKRLNQLDARQTGQEKSMSDLERKLDVAVALLQRIDEKVGRP